MHSTLRVAVCLGLAASFGGCEPPGSPDGLPPLSPCSVEIIQDGQPLAGAMVSLHSPDCKWAVGGPTDETGKAEMWTHGKYAGAPAGTFEVVVTKRLTEEEPNPDHDPEVDNMPMIEHVFHSVDKQYRTRGSSPLELVIVAGENPPASFDIGAAVKEPAN